MTLIIHVDAWLRVSAAVAWRHGNRTRVRRADPGVRVPRAACADADQGVHRVDVRSVDGGAGRHPRRRLPGRGTRPPGLAAGAADLVPRPGPRLPGDRDDVLGGRLPAGPDVRAGGADRAARPAGPAVSRARASDLPGHRGVP